ncbi:N-6 DNA methylase [Rhodanobacter lindaniclasticus]
MADDHRKALVKLLQANAYQHHMHDVFRDFVEMAACALANAIDPVGYDAREAQYMRIIGKYDAEESCRFAQALGALTGAMADEPGDVLGDVFGELEQGNAARGQFFTPASICQLLARLTLPPEHARALIAQRGFFTVQEPACGAGAMVIALALHLREHGINYQQHLHVTAIDVDARAAHMAYVQFALLGIPAVVVIGNSITLEQREVWHTPAHILGWWDNKLRRGYALGSAMDGARPVDPVTAAVAAPAHVGPALAVGQLELFA